MGSRTVHVESRSLWRKVLSLGIVAISLFLLLSRVVSEVSDSQFLTLLLRVEAKCPGLPFGNTSGGPDLIDLSIDAGLAVVAAVFIALTIRDLRRRRRADNGSDDSPAAEVGDDL